MVSARSKDATRAGQILMAGLLDRPLVPDGWWGSYTQLAYDALKAAERGAVDAVLSSYGTSVSKLRTEYKAEKIVNPNAKAEAVADRNRMLSDLQSPEMVFRDRIVPALKREAQSRGMNPVFYVAQLALETGSGRSVPRGAGGVNSYNYGGLKTNVLRSWSGKYSSVKASTREEIGGKSVSIVDGFASFDRPEDFVSAYLWYLHDGPSAYRYPGLASARSITEFATILKRGGYATDGGYITKLAGMEGTAKSLIG